MLYHNKNRRVGSWHCPCYCLLTFWLCSCLLAPAYAISTKDKLIGAIPDNLTVSHGDPVYRIPIQVPAGRNGLQPNLSIVYRPGSQGLAAGVVGSKGNYVINGQYYHRIGEFGADWFLEGTSFVYLCSLPTENSPGTKKVTHKHYCLDGEELVPVAETNGTIGEFGDVDTYYRTRSNGTSLVISRGGTKGKPDYFEVKHNDGTTSIYGKEGNLETDIDIPERVVKLTSDGESSKTVAWAISSKKDQYNNEIIYEYKKDKNFSVLSNPKTPIDKGKIISLKSIRYNDHVIQFHNYSFIESDNGNERKVGVDIYRKKWEGKDYNRLVRSYKLEYGKTDSDKVPDNLFPLSVTLCEKGNNACFESTTFAYKAFHPNLLTSCKDKGEITMTKREDLHVSYCEVEDTKSKSKSYVSGQRISGIFEEKYPEASTILAQPGKVQYTLRSNKETKIMETYIYNENAHHQARLKSITNGNGVVTRLGYTTLLATQDAYFGGKPFYTLGRKAKSHQWDVISNEVKVSSIATDSGLNNSKSTKFRYEGLVLDLTNKRMNGFAKTIEYDVATKMKTETIRDVYDDFPTAGKITKVNRYWAENAEQPIAENRLLTTKELTHRIRHPEGTNSHIKALDVTKERNLEYDPDTQKLLKTTTRTFPKCTRNSILSKNAFIRKYGNAQCIQEVISDKPNGKSYVKRTYRTFEDSENENDWYIGRITEQLESIRKDEFSDFSGTHVSNIKYTFNDEGRVQSKKNRSPSNNSEMLFEEEFTYNMHGEVGVIKFLDGHSTGKKVRKTANTYTGQGELKTSCVYETHAKRCTKYQYDSYGRIKNESKPDGLIIEYEYNGLSQVKKVTTKRGTGGNQKVLGYTKTDYYGIDDTKCSNNVAAHAHYCVVTQQFFNKGDKTYNGDTTITQYDRLNRVVRVITDGTDGSDKKSVFTDTEYKPDGKVERVTEPYFEGTAITDIVSTQMDYDDFGRISKVIRKKGETNLFTTTTRYDGFKTTVSDELNPKSHESSTTVDALGRVIEKCNNMTHCTSYEYDGKGRLEFTKVKGSEHSKITYSYDEYGRKTEIKDPSFGTTKYGYNVFGDITTLTDTLGNETSYEYDRLGRLVKTIEKQCDDDKLTKGDDCRNFTLVRDLETTYCTKKPATGKKCKEIMRARENGQLKTVYHQTYTYDDYARPNTITTKIDDKQYVQTMSYDVKGRLLKVEYPGSSVFYTKNIYKHGALKAVVGNYSHAEPHNVNVDETEEIYDDLLSDEKKGVIRYWQMDAMDAAGRVTKEVYGNGIINTYTFSDKGLLTGTKSTRIRDDKTLKFRNFKYTYDDYGNMIERADKRLGITDTFAYDSLHRLTSAELTSTRDNHVGDRVSKIEYDAFGRIVSKTYTPEKGRDVKVHYTYGGGAAGMYAVTQAGDKYYIYDGKGQLTTVKNNNSVVAEVTWGVYGKPTRISENSQAIEYRYATGSSPIVKVLKDIGDNAEETTQETTQETTHYIGNLMERTSTSLGTVTRFYILAGGKPVAMRYHNSANNKIKNRYFHHDALGSIDLVSSASGKTLERRSYAPWGAKRDFTPKLGKKDANFQVSSDYTNLGFTGHQDIQELSSTSLVHMKGRVYDAELGSFLSPDPIIHDHMGPDGYNRYSYVYNNPLKLTDPSGYAPSGYAPIGSLLHPSFNAANIYRGRARTYNTFLPPRKKEPDFSASLKKRQINGHTLPSLDISQFFKGATSLWNDSSSGQLTELEELKAGIDTLMWFWTGHAGEGHHVTYNESRYWWKHGNGQTLTVDGMMLDPIQLRIIDGPKTNAVRRWLYPKLIKASFEYPILSIPIFGVMSTDYLVHKINFGTVVSPWGMGRLDDLKVHGHVTLNPENNRIYDGWYDFNSMAGSINPLVFLRERLNNRAIVEHGFGTPFEIQYRYESKYFGDGPAPPSCNRNSIQCPIKGF